VALQFARLAATKGHQVISVIRDDTHIEEITKVGAEPHILSLETASVTEIADLIKYKEPQCIVFSAGAGGKGGEERTKAVDYEGALKVFDAMEIANTHRIIMVSAADLRDHEKPAPEYYDEASKSLSERMWKAIPAYMNYKWKADQDLYARKALKFTIVRPGGLTDESANGCELGKPQLGQVSRETVGQVILEMAERADTAGMVLDLMNGTMSTPEAVDKAVEERISSWHG